MAWKCRKRSVTDSWDFYNWRLTHVSAFHAHQVIEKSFKAIIEEYDIGFIKTHSLENLYNKVKERIQLKLNIDVLIMLDQLYIDARYPGELGLLPNGKPSVPAVKRDGSV